MPIPSAPRRRRSSTRARADTLQRLQELGAEVVVAALGLDRLDDERGDVVGLLSNASRICSSDCCSAAATSRNTSSVTGKRSFGLSTRGQEPWEQSVLARSVLVSESA
jgi:hypothetical protein